jgi:hypothetical protein
MNTTQAIDRLRQVIRRQHKALSTEESYIYWLRREIGAVPAMPKELPSEKMIAQAVRLASLVPIPFIQ